MKNDFKFNYSVPSIEERNEIQRIRNSYITPTKKQSKLDYLRKLDSKVKNYPIIISLVIGIIGSLIFGVGLTMILEWNLLAWGIVVCTIALFPIAFAFPSYKFTLNHMKEKYSHEILKISEENLKSI